MTDLTVLMLTANRLPDGWAQYHREVLCDAIGDTPIITISAKPLDWGVNLLQTSYGVTNLWRSILRGAEAADTPYIAIAEDDTLYPACHFEFMLLAGQYGYDLHRWAAMTWSRRPFYYLRPTPANGLMIAWRSMVVDAIRARLEGVDELTSYRARELGVHPRTRRLDGGDAVTWYSREPVVSLCHEQSVDLLNARHTKRPGVVQAFDIPKWRKAKWIVGKFQ